MTQIINSLFATFFLFLKEREVRQSVLKPGVKTLQIYVLSFFSVVFILVMFFSFKGSSESIWTLLLSVSGSFVSLIFLPFIIAYVYLSFFCDRYYEEIVGGISKGDTIVAESSPITQKFQYGKIILFILCLPLLLILSFFIPFISLLLGGFIFGADMFSQSLSGMKLPYSKQAGYIMQHFVPVTGMGIILLSLSFVPFAILLIYPLGVKTASDFYSRNYK